MDTILTFDPGARNFAWAFLDGARFKTGMLTIVTGKPDEVVTAFRSDLEKLFADFHPDKVVIERFMTRPGRGSPNNESINLLIGAVLCYCAERGVAVKAITSAVWKAAFRRASNSTADDVKISGKTDHECDALGMAAYEAGNDIIIGLMSLSALLTDVERTHRTRKKHLMVKDLMTKQLMTKEIQLCNISPTRSSTKRLVERLS